MENFRNKLVSLNCMQKQTNKQTKNLPAGARRGVESEDLPKLSWVKEYGVIALGWKVEDGRQCLP